MEQYAYKDLTLRIFRDMLDESEFRDYRKFDISSKVGYGVDK